MGHRGEARLTAAVTYLAAYTLPWLLGAPFALLAPQRTWWLPARLALAFALGSLALAIESTAMTLMGMPWNPWVPLLISGVLTVVLWRRRKETLSRSKAPRPGLAAAGVLVGTLCLAFGYLASSIGIARATSTDYLIFWGPKAVRFAAAKAVDPDLLTWEYFRHAQPFYPPLTPVLDAWAVLATGQMPWRIAPFTTLIWWGATVVLVMEILRRRLRDRPAALITSFWGLAMGSSLVASFSAGAAEAPLLLYTTAGSALLLAQRERPAAGERLLAGVFLAGAVFTKVEGSIISSFLICGVAWRDSLTEGRIALRRLLPLAVPPLCVGLGWVTFLTRFDIPTGYLGRGTLLNLPGDPAVILPAIVGSLSAGVYWVSWIFPVMVLLATARRRQLRHVLPGFVCIIGLLVFLAAVYLHEPRDPGQRIRWEVPRASQTALSLLILAAGIVSFRRPPATITISGVSGREP